MEEKKQKKLKQFIETLEKEAEEPKLEFIEFPGVKQQLKLQSFFKIPKNEIFCVRFDPDDEYIATGCTNGSVHIYNVSTGELEYTLPSYAGINQTPTTSLRWRPSVHCKTKQVLVSVNSDGSIMHWHVASGKLLHRMQEKDHSILCMDYNPEGSMFATAGQDFHVRVYDEDTKSVVVDFEPADWSSRGHANRVFSTKFMPQDPNLILSGGWDSNVEIWDIRQKSSVATIYGPSISGDSLDYRDGLILTGSYRNEHQLQLWDFKTRKLFRQIDWNPGHSAQQIYVYSTQFSKLDSKSLAAGSSGQNEFMMYDAKNDYKPFAGINKLEGGVYSVDYANKSNIIAFAGGSGVLYLIDTSAKI